MKKQTKLPAQIPGKSVPVLKSHVSVKQFKLQKDGREDSNCDLQQWFKRKQSVWPTDGVSYFSNEKEQIEDVIQILSNSDSQAPKNLVEFNFKNKCFTAVESVTQNINLLDVEGFCLHIDSQEAKEQLAEHCTAPDKIQETENENIVKESVDDVSKTVDDDESIDEVDDDENKDTKCDKDETNQSTGTGKTKKLTNQFNFCERGTTTYENSLKHVETKAEPPIQTVFSDYASQWIIYDSYLENNEKRIQEKEKGKKEKSQALQKQNDKNKKNDSQDFSLNIINKMLILERMINQNMFGDTLQDFRYYEDPSDEYRNNEGTLLPLWKFCYNMTKKLSITDIKWNPAHYDLFAVSFGSFDFQKQFSKGCFCLWSLKNPSIPEYIYFTESAIMSLDFHPIKTYLIVIGMYDGMVAVYDLRVSNKAPIYESDNVNNKHSGIVWQVKWCEKSGENELIFYSISSDGQVLRWTSMENQLVQTLVINIVQVQYPSITKNESRKDIKNSGACIALHPVDESIFLVGTDEGYIYKCSTAYLSIYLFIYEAHHMPVYCIDYNKYSSNVFVSCSADWTIKVWEDERKEPLFIFDTVSSVEDVSWAPYSSTVFAAVSSDCKIHVFDLNVSKYKSICMQTIYSRKTCTPTKLAFNWKVPIIVVGDDKGFSSVFKLSPNLRMKSKLTKKQQNIDLKDIEIQKLDKLLSLIREPSEMKNFNVINSTETSSL